MVQTRSDNAPKSNKRQTDENTNNEVSDTDFDCELESIDNDICDYSESIESSDDTSVSTTKPIVTKVCRKNNIVIKTPTPIRRSSRFSKCDVPVINTNKKISNKRTRTHPVRRQSKRLRQMNQKVSGKLLKIINSRSDSDNSDIDLESSDENSETTDFEEYGENQDIRYTSLVDSIVSEITGETRDAVQRKNCDLRTARWKKDLTKKEISKLETQYDSICKVIRKMPTIKELLTTDMPFKTKCCLMEKIIILDNIQDDTFDHLHLKTSINEEIRKYSTSKINADNYTQYADIEKKIESIDCVDMPLKYRILSSDMPLSNKIAIYNKFKHLENISDMNSEHSKLTNWMDIAMSLPYNINGLSISINDGNQNINSFLCNVKAKLDEKIYGLTKVKEQILFVLNNMITNPKSRGVGMALVGPQGVGKTELANVLADAIKLPFVSIPLGGSNDSSFLSGHSYTYEGSMPGAIVTSVIKMKQLNGIIFFDELDKISDTRYGSEVSKLLLHITDSTQNHDFKDKYLGNDISVNLSNIWFIYSLNYIDALDRTLRDRIPIVMVDGYTKTEKKEIVNRHLLPNELKNVGMNIGDIMFSDASLIYLINKTDAMYTHETKSKSGKSGVRQLKHIISNIVMKFNMINNCILDDGTFGDLKLPYNIKGFKLPFVIEITHIDMLDVLPSMSSDAPLSMYS